jgi:subtilisin family serine protease
MADGSEDRDVRYYVVLHADSALERQYFNPDPVQAAKSITEYLVSQISPGIAPSFTVQDLPSWSAFMVKKREALSQLVATLSISDRKWLSIIGDAIANSPDKFFGGGADIPFSLADHWCPRGALDPMFADRAAAENLIGVPALRDEQNLTGEGVNVVIVDQGLDKDRLGSNYVDGWQVGDRGPGTTPEIDPDSRRVSHGMMIARNILSVAPDAKLFDLPIAPRKISDIPAFLSQVDAPIRLMLQDIEYGRGPAARSGSWILVNPWGVHDTRSDLDPPRDYANNRDHAFNRLIVEMTSKNIDIVFAAGNCGQFCPDGRCGPTDRGPGHSIHGANSLSEVLTVGAVRADEMWLGYSSQGPGRDNLGTKKPDLCASSQFRETKDAHVVNTGTSAACALVGGVIAALRSRWPADARVPPSKLNTILRDSARPPCTGYSTDRFGSGILDARAAFDRLSRECGPGILPS